MNTNRSEADGRALRKHVPRSAAADWRPDDHRPDSVDILARQDSQRIGDLVAERHRRMSVSLFTFFRGAAALMASDFSSLPVTGLTAQLAGDAHLDNFGVFGSPTRELLFDLNDFDETLQGPWEWDLYRLATSFTIAARDRGFDDDVVTDLTAAAVCSYRQAMWNFASQSPLDVWYAHLDTADLRTEIARRSAKAAHRMDKQIAAARRHTSVRAVHKLTEEVDGTLRFRSAPPVLLPLGSLAHDVHAGDLTDAIRDNYRSYVATLDDARRALLARFEVVDVAHKVVGVGSVGLRAFVVLLQAASGNPLVLQFKEATTSVLEGHLPGSPYEHHGQRVVEGQRMLQAASDIFLGWSTSFLDDRQYYWRQLWDMKGSSDVDTMSPRALHLYAGMCGWSLARAHARSGPVAAIAGYLGTSDTFDRAAIALASHYADLNARDFADHKQAVDEGRFGAEHTAPGAVEPTN